MTDRSIKINVPVLARVEGEGALDLCIDDNRISELKLRIFEPPRYFEKLLEGRDYTEVPDIVARICGICPVAYQMSAVHAIESIFGVQPSSWVRAMRRLIYCGEWLQSHSLHIHMLAAPDFVGVNSVLEMAQHYPEEVRRGLRLQSLGNAIITLAGARSVHPVGVCVGGFYKAPEMKAIEDIHIRLQQATEDADALLEWLLTLALPDDEQTFNQVSLRHEQEYPMNEGRIISSRGLECAIENFEMHFDEHHEPHSTALYCLLDNQPYLVGPLARLNNNLDYVSKTVLTRLEQAGLTFPSTNMFHSIIARAVEIYIAIHEALQILDNYSVPEQTREHVTPVAGIGYGCTEAPRGLLWHRYQIDGRGIVCDARIVPPTSQNQSRIEQDLINSLGTFGLDRDEDAIRLHAETVIRNYDPCISCATHFLKVSVSRRQQTESMNPKTNSRKKNIVVIGVGSPQLNDQLGWQVVQRLARSKANLMNQGVDFVVLDRPGLKLRDYLNGMNMVLLVDSMYGEGADNQVICIDVNKLSADPVLLSSHEIGLEQTLILLAELHELPKTTLIYGVCNNCNDDDMAIDQAVALIENKIADYL